MAVVTTIISRIFGAIGAICLLIAIFLIVSTLLFISQASVADGTVVEPKNPVPDRRYNSVIEFTASNGQLVRYTSGVSSNPAEFQFGQKVKIYYNSNDPQGSARPDSYLSLWFLPTLAGILAIVFGGIAGGFFLAGYTSRKKLRWLQQNGQRVKAEITSVGLNKALRNNGKNPYFVMARWHDPLTKRVYNFKSDSLWVEPTTLSPGTNVDVLIDPKNYDRYQVIVDPSRG